MRIIIRGGISSVTGVRYVKSDENIMILYIDAINFHGWAMSEFLPYDETEMWHGDPGLYMNKLEGILNISQNSDIGYFLWVDLRCPDNIKEKTKIFPFCPEHKKNFPNKCNDYMNKIKPKNDNKAKKTICDWTDKRKDLIHFRMLKSYVRHGMVIDKLQETISLNKVSCWKNIVVLILNNQTRLKMNLKKTSISYVITHFMEKHWQMYEIL